MQVMTEAEYAQYGPITHVDRRRCPNPGCDGGMDRLRNIGRLLTVRPVCAVCDGIGEVLVTTPSAA